MGASKRRLELRRKTMNSNVAKAALGVGAIVVAVVLFVVLKDDSGESTNTNTNRHTSTNTNTKTSPSTRGTSAKTPVIVVEHGKPVGGVRDLTYNEGERIRFEVRSDVSDEIHVHGYGLMKDVKAGGSVEFDFRATIEGIFEAELEGRGEEIAQLTVNP
jgi:hypothetical protein